jgi:hypothetical protein
LAQEDAVGVKDLDNNQAAMDHANLIAKDLARSKPPGTICASWSVPILDD